ncbi:hypothetical protein VP277E431_P0043 [Vibrio phage 277E43-1]|nr:hypothetical protein VP277E431_P0043 [Vibrio phage 277E43-1]
MQTLRRRVLLIFVIFYSKLVYITQVYHKNNFN